MLAMIAGEVTLLLVYNLGEHICMCNTFNSLNSHSRSSCQQLQGSLQQYLQHG